jgi:hypothetical protein
MPSIKEIAKIAAIAFVTIAVAKRVSLTAQYL